MGVEVRTRFDEFEFELGDVVGLVADGMGSLEHWVLNLLLLLGLFYFYRLWGFLFIFLVVFGLLLPSWDEG